MTATGKSTPLSPGPDLGNPWWAPQASLPRPYTAVLLRCKIPIGVEGAPQAESRPQDETRPVTVCSVAYFDGSWKSLASFKAVTGTPVAWKRLPSPGMIVSGSYGVGWEPLQWKPTMGEWGTFRNQRFRAQNPDIQGVPGGCPLDWMPYSGTPRSEDADPQWYTDFSAIPTSQSEDHYVEVLYKDKVNRGFGRFTCSEVWGRSKKAQKTGRGIWHTTTVESGSFVLLAWRFATARSAAKEVETVPTSERRKPAGMQPSPQEAEEPRVLTAPRPPATSSTANGADPGIRELYTATYRASVLELINNMTTQNAARTSAQIARLSMANRKLLALFGEHTFPEEELMSPRERRRRKRMQTFGKKSRETMGVKALQEIIGAVAQTRKPAELQTLVRTLKDMDDADDASGTMAEARKKIEGQVSKLSDEITRGSSETDVRKVADSAARAMSRGLSPDEQELGVGMYMSGSQEGALGADTFGNDPEADTFGNDLITADPLDDDPLLSF